MRILALLEKNKNFWFLLFTSFFFFLLRLPSLFEPYWYGDEGIYQTIGIAIREGRGLYTQIWDNKPPLLYVLYAIFNGDQFTVRLVSLIFGILSVIIFFFVAKKLFKNGKNSISIYLSTAVFALFFGLPLIEGNIANSENFMILPILLSALLILNTVELRSKENKPPPISHLSPLLSFFSPLLSPLFLSGLLLGFAFLFKIVAIFDTASFFLFLLILKARRLSILVKSAAQLFPFIAGFIIPIFLTFIFFLSQGSLAEFIKASFLQNVGYVAYGNTFLFPQSILLIKLTILSAVVFVLFKNRSKLSAPLLFIILWTAFSLFNSLFSQRPYTHYVLTLLPAFSLFIGLLFENKFRKYLIILLILIIIVMKNFNLYKKTALYYFNFLEFVSGQKSISSYYAFFDRKTPVDYQLSEFLKKEERLKDDVFIWGNNAQVYKLSNKLPIGRYTVVYHMTSSKESLEETKKVFEQKKPKYVIMVSKENFPFSLSNYYQRLNIENIPVYEKIY